MPKKQNPKRMSVRQDLTAVEGKVDTILETVNEIREDVRGTRVMISQLPTKDELETLLKDAIQLSTLKNDLDRVKKFLRENLNATL